MKVCPECNNLADPRAMICGYCGRSLVGIQEESFELELDIKPKENQEEDKNNLANSIYGEFNDLKDNYKIKDVSKENYLYTDNKKIYLFIAIIFLIVPLIRMPKEFKMINILDIVSPITVGFIFLLLSFIKILSNKNKIIVAFITISSYIIWSFFFFSSIEGLAFINRNIYIPYDLEARGLMIFFYISIFFSFLSSSLKNSIYALIAIVISILSMFIVFFYTPHLEFKEMLVFQVYMDYEIIEYMFKISPLIIISYMIFSVGDTYYRIILQYFLIIFLSYQYYGYLRGINYSIIESIFIAKEFILYIIAIYIFSFFLYKIIVMFLLNLGKLLTFKKVKQ